MAGQRRVVMASLAAVAAGTMTVALTVFAGVGGGHATSLGAAATQPLSFAQGQAAATTVTGPPAKVPAAICGNKPALTGPRVKPKGAVKVPAGNNGVFNFGRGNTVYWFAPGIHTFGNTEFDNIVPLNNSTFIGAPGAILDGKHIQDSAFDGTATHITIKFLTIRNFGKWGGGGQEGVVNHDSGSYWTIVHDTIAGNAGAGVMLGSHDTLAWSCIRANQQYGFNAYSNNGTIHDLLLDHNEIAFNDTYNYEARFNGCGCSGGGKFWNVINARVTNNWIINNKSVGLWADTDNAGFEFVGNYFTNNQNIGLMYEISYNALIEYNTFLHNGVGTGPSTNDFPTSAIYISESGSDSRVHTQYANQFLVAHNNFVDNWGGIVLWENSNRFCASPDNSSTGYCTMVNPSVVNLKSCGNSADIGKTPYISDCRWKAKNFLIEDNLFSFRSADLGKHCTLSNFCGYNGVFSEYGSQTPYQGDMVPTNIAYNQNNHFVSNTYVGPWCFMGWQLGTSVGWNQWRAARNAGNIGDPSQTFGQDAKSTHKGASRSCARPS